jgi:hypothetical protein
MTTICASKIDWKNGYGNANATHLFNGFSNRVPNEFAVSSPRTGTTKAFKVDIEEAEQSEFWDGEFQIFRSEDKKHSIRIWNY